MNQAVNVGAIVGFMVVGFALNPVIGTARRRFFTLSKLTAMRRVERATVAGYLRVGLGRDIWQSDQRRHGLQAHMPSCWPSQSPARGGAVSGGAAAAPRDGLGGVHG